jgi:hypothetical protein
MSSIVQHIRRLLDQAVTDIDQLLRQQLRTRTTVTTDNGVATDNGHIDDAEKVKRVMRYLERPCLLGEKQSSQG